ncbi:hypothetical protein FVA74_04455 [Salinibacterium sp. dk2585]|uniref:hypothetical protein n=1 Tax=unclassified Salinibacterium TaxID=2632331 RepID=UPI0011C2451C|nr:MULTISPECIES: hypothetical protein [unclassified Salinibacterium]QEE60915.1 hypothetical protein FVA74_04455 [Salinibacterium sp. dk2585]TXK55986.1 hypothetical protein FVP63_04600 [Salinibacterium sp. dk5596]
MELLDLARNVLVILHFIGLASLLGGFLTQMSAFKTKSVVINPAILHGALTQLVTGLLLVTVAEMGDGDVNHMKIGIKLAVALAIYVIALVNRKKKPVSSAVLGIIGALTLVNVVVAVVVPGMS